MDAYQYESFIKSSLCDCMVVHIHGGTMLSEWFRIRYESLVLAIKAVIIMGQPIKIHPEHLNVNEDNELTDKRFFEIPKKFRRKIVKPVLFGDFEPNISEIYRLLISPSKVNEVNISEMYPRKDIVSMIGYFQS